MKLNALIVDDEHSGRVTLKILLHREFPLLFDKIIPVSTLMEAIEKVRSGFFNICFLDIELGNKSGFELIPYLPADTKIIFVTAYSEYAIKAIKQQAFDYLLKPVAAIDLRTSVNRYQSLIKEENFNRHITVKVNGFSVPVPLREIHYIEAKGPYSKIHLANDVEYTTSKTLKTITQLVGSDFIRIHKSYTVNLSRIKSFNKDAILTTTNVCLPVSRLGAKVLSRFY